MKNPVIFSVMHKLMRFLPLLACSLLTTCSSEKCSLQAELVMWAGQGAVNCGHVGIGGDRTMTDDCVVQAFEGGMAFHARYELQGIDSHVALGIARSASGTLTLLQYDGDPGGGGGDDHPVISAYVCSDPRIMPALSERPESAWPFTCGSTQNLGRVCE